MFIDVGMYAKTLGVSRLGEELLGRLPDEPVLNIDETGQNENSQRLRT